QLFQNRNGGVHTLGELHITGTVSTETDIQATGHSDLVRGFHISTAQRQMSLVHRATGWVNGDLRTVILEYELVTNIDRGRIRGRITITVGDSSRPGQGHQTGNQRLCITLIATSIWSAMIYCTSLGQGDLTRYINADIEYAVGYINIIYGGGGGADNLTVNQIQVDHHTTTGQ